MSLFSPQYVGSRFSTLQRRDARPNGMKKARKRETNARANEGKIASYRANYRKFTTNNDNLIYRANYEFHVKSTITCMHVMVDFRQSS